MQSGGASGYPDFRDRSEGPNLATALAMLPTPRVIDSRQKGNGPRPDTITGLMQYDGRRRRGADEQVLLPTPHAGNFNDGEDLESWEARRQRNLAKGYNGDGQGTPLSVAVRRDMPVLPTPSARDTKGVSARGPHADGYVRADRDHDLPTTVDRLPLFRTPTAQLAVNGGSQDPDKRRAGGHGPTLADEVEQGPVSLLPTPTASLNPPGFWRPGVMWWLQGRAARNLEGVVSGNTGDVSLLPTPRAQLAEERNQYAFARPPGQPQNLENALAHVDPGELLPTPTVADGEGGHLTRGGARSDEALLPGVVKMLPTPGATDWKGSNEPVGRDRDGRPRTAGDADLPAAVEHLLPTPVTGYTERDGEAWRDARPAGNGGRREQVGDLQIVAREELVPTPRATRGGSATETMYGLGGERDDTGRPQGEVLLPTPRATDGPKGAPGQRGSSGDLMLPSAVLTDWGKYARAVLRWEQVLGRLAPPPLEEVRRARGSRGKGRLSPRFVEWMMGLPDGWVTGTGISRNAQLKALGNGVVPQQILLGLQILADRIRSYGG